MFIIFICLCADYGLSFEGSLSIKEIRPESVAATQGDLKQGDQITKVAFNAFNSDYTFDILLLLLRDTLKMDF